MSIYGLWESASLAADRSAFEARRQADFTATTLRRTLREARTLDHVPSHARFAWVDGELDVARVGWLTPPAPVRAKDLDILLQDKLEVVHGAASVEDARKIWAELLADASQPRAHREWLLVDAGWFAHRSGLQTWRDTLLARLHEVDGGAVPSATILLHLAAHGTLPSWAPARIPLLTETTARAVLRRAADCGVEVGAIERQLRVNLENRARLARVQSFARSLGAEGTRGIGEWLLVLQGTRARGRGALLDRTEFAALVAKLTEQAWAGVSAGAVEQLAVGEPEGAFAVVPGWVAVAVRPDAPRVGGGSLLSILIVALALITIAGMWVFVRGVRKQAVAAQARSEFLTMVTHELKTPLAGIRLLAEMLEDGHVEGEQRRQEYYGRLTRESVRLGMLIENVLDLGRMERGERAYDFREVSIDDVVAEAAEMFAPIAEQSGMELRSVPEAHCVVRADRGAILQSLLNVMENARKYARDGRLIELATSMVGDCCRVTVRDHGPGIPDGERGAIFERFQRGARHRDGHVPGVGLGLYLSRVILRSHGGELSVVDGDGAGSCFRLDLPVQLGGGA